MNYFLFESRRYILCRCLKVESGHLKVLLSLFRYGSIVLVRAFVPLFPSPVVKCITVLNRCCKRNVLTDGELSLLGVIGLRYIVKYFNVILVPRKINL